MAVSSELLETYDTHDIYDVLLDDDQILTTVTRDAAVVDDWICDIERIHRRRLHKLIVGLDVEWRPNFNRGHSNPVATLQLCVGRRCLIFQIIHAQEIPQSLQDFLADGDYTFYGVGIYQDVEKLEDDWGLVVGHKVVDLRSFAVECLGQQHFINAGLRALGREIRGKDVVKPRNITMSRWDNEWLTQAQVQYACVDAYLSFEIARFLKRHYH